MLDGYGLHSLVWNRVDERFEEILVASSADAVGRGISLVVRQDGAAADLTGATAYLVWRHRVSGKSAGPWPSRRWTPPRGRLSSTIPQPCAGLPVSWTRR